MYIAVYDYWTLGCGIIIICEMENRLDQKKLEEELKKQTEVTRK